ncbi:MAG: carbohydrate porin [bacterium]
MRCRILLTIVALTATLTGVAPASAAAGTEEAGEESSETQEQQPPGGTDATSPLPIRGKELEAIRELILERVGLSLHGGVLGYYQGTNGVDIDHREFDNPDGAGFAADLELGFSPIPGGEVLLRIHAGEGDGADRFLEPAGALLADLNTINDDNPGDDGLKLLEAFYTQALFEGRLLFSVGKTEPLLFLDENAFANDEYAQFVGKPFVNNPVLDSEDEYAPLMALRVRFIEEVTCTLVGQSSTRPLLEGDQQKSAYEKIFNKPFVGGQIEAASGLGGLEGHYRLYAWFQTYRHPRLAGSGSEEGWGVGFSLDQQILERVGLFARLGCQNDEVYEVPWFWSAGTSVQGLFAGRPEDVLGMGIAGLKANEDLQDDGTELHLEAYWRFAWGEHFALSPDIQYVLAPLGDGDNDGVVAGMIRGEAYF